MTVGRARPLSGGHGYSPDMVCLCLRLVLEAGVSLRAAPRAVAVVSESLGLGLAAPCWTTVRSWVLRLGHALRTAALERADDWAWLIDHSVQIGQDKCLVILGIRLSHLPAPGQCLRHRDLHLIELLPAKRWTRADVARALEDAVARTGFAPRVIVDDHGVDLAGGVALFRQHHAQTVEVYDAKHKAACLLKRRLGNEEAYARFQSQLAQARCAVQQTEMAFLTPPAPKPKARFMNLGPHLKWARRVLAIVRHPPASVRRAVRQERLTEKFGWLEAFAGELDDWSQWQQVVDVAVAVVNGRGICKGVARSLARECRRLGPPGGGARKLAAELTRFVRGHEGQVRPGERFPGSTEALESCFGKFKHLEKQQARGGFTSLLLGFGAMLAELTTATVRAALQASRTADVKTWMTQTLGPTLFSQRKLAFAGATETG